MHKPTSNSKNEYYGLCVGICSVFLLFLILINAVEASDFCFPESNQQELFGQIGSFPFPGENLNSKTSSSSASQNYSSYSIGLNQDFAYQLTGSLAARADFGVLRGELAKGPSVAVFDEGDHLRGVSYVVNEASAFSSNATQGFSVEILRSPEKIAEIFSQASVRSGRAPSVVNISYSLGNDQNIARSIQHLCDSGVSVVISTGNDGDDRLDSNNTVPCAIYVASTSPQGTMDFYSQHAQGDSSIFQIQAPVGNHLGVDFGSGYGEQNAYGTSFAAPQVAAAIADVKAILPGLTTAEIKIIMQKTSMQGLNGAILNHYKMIKVAEKIKSTGSSVDDASSYEFTAEASRLLNSNDPSLWQRAYLLDSQGSVGEKARAKLAASYTGGLQDFYKSLDVDHADEYLQELASRGDPVLTELANRSKKIRSGEWSTNELQQFASSSNPSVQTFAYLELIDRSDEFSEKEIQKMLELKSAHTSALQITLQESMRSPKTRTKENLAKVVGDSLRSNNDDTSAEFSALRSFSADQRVNILQEFLIDSRRVVRLEAQNQLGQAFFNLGSQQSFQHIQTLNAEQSEALYSVNLQAFLGAEQKRINARIESHDQRPSLGEEMQVAQSVFLGKPEGLMPFVRNYFLAQSASFERQEILAALQQAETLWRQQDSKEDFINYLRGLAQSSRNSAIQEAAKDSLENFK